MVYNITVHIEYGADCDYPDVYGVADSELPITENIDDVIAYLFEERYGKPYDEMTWFFEKGAKDFVKDIKDRWYSNEFDALGLYSQPEFIEFLGKRYEGTDTEDYDLLSEVVDDVQYALSDMSESELKSLIQEQGNHITVYAGTLTRSIDLEECLYDLYG